VIVIKDIDDPIIYINFPTTNELFGSNPPLFNLTVIEPNIDLFTYSLDGGVTEIPYSPWCSQYAWQQCPDGYVTVSFFVEDMLGHNESVEVVIRKDATPPSITINAPIGGQEYTSEPDFTLTIPDSDLDCIWYSLDDGETNYPCGLTGKIDSTLWSNLENGQYTIKFYANDTIGNLGFSSVSISKTDFMFVIVISAISGGAMIGLVSYIWIRKKRK
jgi:hypothetical protein